MGISLSMRIIYSKSVTNLMSWLIFWDKNTYSLHVLPTGKTTIVTRGHCNTKTVFPCMWIPVKNIGLFISLYESSYNITITIRLCLYTGRAQPIPAHSPTTHPPPCLLYATRLTKPSLRICAYVMFTKYICISIWDGIIYPCLHFIGV